MKMTAFIVVSWNFPTLLRMCYSWLMFGLSHNIKPWGVEKATEYHFVRFNNGLKWLGTNSKPANFVGTISIGIHVKCLYKCNVRCQRLVAFLSLLSSKFIWPILQIYLKFRIKRELLDVLGRVSTTFCDKTGQIIQTCDNSSWKFSLS